MRIEATSHPREVVRGGPWWGTTWRRARSPKKKADRLLPARCVFAVEWTVLSGDAEQAMDMLLDSVSSLINTNWCEGVIRTHHFRRHS